MSSRRSSKDTPEADSPEPDEGRLTGVKALQHDDDERPSREDRSYGETIFTRPAVPMPRWLRGRKDKS
jgi:hypothetical protein